MKKDTNLVHVEFRDVFGEKVDRDGVFPIVVVPAGQLRGGAAVGPVDLLVSVVKGGAVLRVASEKSSKSNSFDMKITIFINRDV